jgi:hypothetical protein
MNRIRPHTLVRKIVYLFSSVALMSLASCTITKGLSPEGIKERGLKSGEGYIVGSFNYVNFNDPGRIQPGVILRSSVVAQPENKSNRQRIIMDTNWPSKGMNWSLMRADNPPYFAIPVAAGNYEVTNWYVETYGMTVTNRLPMKVPFQVKAGEAAYIGKANVIALNGKNLLNTPIIMGAVVLITDDYEKDAKEISRAFPSINRSQIRKTNVPSSYLKEVKRISNTPKNWWDAWLI